MGKSSVEWQELHGLRTYVQHLKSVKVQSESVVTAKDMAEMRIKELEDLGV